LNSYGSDEHTRLSLNKHQSNPRWRDNGSSDQLEPCRMTSREDA
jgi:hypothetical protein